MNDPINHPQHYQSEKGIEVIDVIEAFNLPYHLGNVVKYILRAGKKGNMITDLKKAAWYLERDIDRRERHAVGDETIINTDKTLDEEVKPARLADLISKQREENDEL